MQKRKLGKSNLEVSAIGFGCMGLNFSYGHALSKEESITLVHCFIDFQSAYLVSLMGVSNKVETGVA